MIRGRQREKDRVREGRAWSYCNLDSTRCFTAFNYNETIGVYSPLDLSLVFPRSTFAFSVAVCSKSQRNALVSSSLYNESSAHVTQVSPRVVAFLTDHTDTIM